MKKAFYLFIFVLFTQTTTAFAQTNKISSDNNIQISEHSQINTQTGYDWGDDGYDGDDDSDKQ